MTMNKILEINKIALTLLFTKFRALQFKTFAIIAGIALFFLWSGINRNIKFIFILVIAFVVVYTIFLLRVLFEILYQRICNKLFNKGEGKQQTQTTPQNISFNFKKYYTFQDYINKINTKMITDMYMPVILGLDQRENIITQDLAEIKHLFINGESGGGKSSMINCILQSLMILTDSTIYILIDLKGGAELSDYKDFGHVILIYTIEDMHKIVVALEKIMEKRLALVRNTRKCKDLNGYMERTGETHTNIVCVIDEIASVRLSGYEQHKTLESSMIQLLQKGRVTNIHCIGATQKPSGEQINTNVRAGFLQNISFQVKDKITQIQTKVLGTEKLNTGEWKSTFSEDNIYKGFLIRDTEDKKRGLPECNQVFDNLESILINKNKPEIFVKNKEIDIIKDKRFLHKFKSKLNKTSQVKLSGDIDYRQLIKDIPSIVIDDITELKKLSGIEENLQENDISCDSDNYSNFLNFVFVNRKEDFSLPSTKFIEEKLKISKTQRLNFLNQALEENLLIRKNERISLINIENDFWKELEQQQKEPS